MRASQAIERLSKLIEEHGDCYVVRETEDRFEGIDIVEEVEVEPYHETKYFKIK